MILKIYLLFIFHQDKFDFLRIKFKVKQYILLTTYKIYKDK